MVNELRLTTSNALPTFSTTVSNKVGSRLSFSNSNAVNLGRTAVINVLDPNLTRVWKGLKISGSDVTISFLKKYEEDGSDNLLTSILIPILEEGNAVDIDVEFIIHRLNPSSSN